MLCIITLCMLLLVVLLVRAINELEAEHCLKGTAVIHTSSTHNFESVVWRFYQQLWVGKVAKWVKSKIGRRKKKKVRKQERSWAIRVELTTFIGLMFNPFQLLFISHQREPWVIGIFHHSHTPHHGNMYNKNVSIYLRMRRKDLITFFLNHNWLPFHQVYKLDNPPQLRPLPYGRILIQPTMMLYCQGVEFVEVKLLVRATQLPKVEF